MPTAVSSPPRRFRAGPLPLSVTDTELEQIGLYFDRHAITFGLYKNARYQDRIFPFGVVPRVFAAQEFARLEAGLIQRVTALNLFLSDLYGSQQVLRDKVVPPEFVFASSGFLRPCLGIKPSGGIYSHLSGIDLVQAADGSWYVLEDNLRVPSGASYPLIARQAYQAVCSSAFPASRVADNQNYPQMLLETLEAVSTGGLNVLLSPGRYNSAFFEHAYLAERMGIPLVFGDELTCRDGKVYYRGLGGLIRVGAIYRRISDEYLDPLAFESDSLIGVPGLFEAYARGNVAVLNAFGNGVADDKGLYYFVPSLVKYYLGEEPILQNAPTYLPHFPSDRAYVLANLSKLVIKDVAEAGGYGVVFGARLSRSRREELRDLIVKEPRRWIAQEVVNFRDEPVFQGGKVVPRKADFRAYVLSGSSVRVWKSGLTRYAMEAGSMIVNSSQGGGFKDTWVLA